MSEVSWIKVSTDLFENRKIKQIERMPDGWAVTLIWVKLLCLAGTVNDGGRIYLTKDIPYTEETLSAELGMPVETVKTALDIFCRFGMIAAVDSIICISNWEKYQNAEALERMKAQRREVNARYYRTHKKLPEDGPDSKTSDKISYKTSYKNGSDAIDKIREDKKREDSPSAGACKSNDAETDRPAGEENRDQTEQPSLPPTPEQKAAFRRFRRDYPKKAGLAGCEKLFYEALTKISERDLLRRLSSLVNCPDWTRENGRFVPMAEKWLKAEGWLDAPADPEDYYTFVNRQDTDESRY